MKVDAVKTMKEIEEKLHFSGDLKTRTVQFFGVDVCLCYIADITDNMLLNETLIDPMLKFQGEQDGDIVEVLKNEVLSNQEVEEFERLQNAIDKLLAGNTLILVNNSDKILGCDMEKITVRAVAEPPTSVVIKGPREGFNESLKYNLALIRRRAKSDDLVVKTFELGELTKTQISVVYFNSVADKKVVKEVLRRLKNIKIDGVVDSHYLVSYLQKNPNSLFKQVGDAEKPDILVGKMLEGRVGVLVDGSPIALTVPFLLVEDLQNSDDYYSQPIRVTFIRILRLVGVIVAVLLPGVYVALEKYHYKIIPIEFLVTIMNTTQGIPFSPFIELLFVVLLFEILYEANLRMPQYFGMAMSIVGALILGETAINAGLVSPPAVMIVALSGITFYIIPSQAAQFSILRLLALVIGASIGLYGVLLFCVFLISYLSSFDSYDTPYLAPTTPFIKSDQKDLYRRDTIKDMIKRPLSVANNRKNLKRRDKNDG
ncbi:MAG: spore germination protein [Clostridiales bacterium]|nr:spore germination protein [Clostridiales bacterium]